jgi:hypothetical protein
VIEHLDWHLRDYSESLNGLGAEAIPWATIQDSIAIVI